jgi:dienelactone hydrolase
LIIELLPGVAALSRMSEDSSLDYKYGYVQREARYDWETPMARSWFAVLMFAAAVSITACDREPAARPVTQLPEKWAPPPPLDAPKELPKPPLDLPKPKDLPAVHDGIDLSKKGADELVEMAMMAGARRDNKTALAAQFWAVQKGAVDAQLFLADVYALNEQYDEAFYWLQQAAINEGVDVRRLAPDGLYLDSLRDDRRYPKVIEFLGQCNAYWAEPSHQHPMVVIPANFEKTKPSPVIVSFYFLDSRPDQFCGKVLQEMADKIGLPFICVTNARPLERCAGSWQVFSPDELAKRTEAVLAEVADRVTISPGGVITLGFSGGADLALQVAAREPNRYCGAIALEVSPLGEPQLANLEPSDKLKRSRFIIATGGDPGKSTVSSGERYRDWLRNAGAEVKLSILQQIGGRQLQDGSEKQFREWVAFILQKK